MADDIGPSLDLFRSSETENETNLCTGGNVDSTKNVNASNSFQQENVEPDTLNFSNESSEMGPNINLFLKKEDDNEINEENTEKIEDKTKINETKLSTDENVDYTNNVNGSKSFQQTKVEQDTLDILNESSEIGPDISLFLKKENDKEMNEENTEELDDKTIITENIGPDVSLFVTDAHKKDISIEPPKKKIKKGCEFADVHLNALPKAKYYQLSYMHRTPLTHVEFSKSGFLVTASIDGNVKFWKKAKVPGLDFVKKFRAHLDAISDMKMSHNGEICATIGADKTIKIFDILNCDMINMIRLDFVPYCCCWIYSHKDASKYLAVSEAGSKNIFVINAFEKNEIMKKITELHDATVNIIIFNKAYETVISLDSEGMIEYWTGVEGQFKFPEQVVKFQFKTDTDLYELFHATATPIAASCSPDGRVFAVYSSDRKIRIFDFKRGRLLRTIDESIHSYTDTDKAKEIASMELGRRLAVEKELERNDFKFNISLEFDYSSNFLIYPSLMGLKVVDVRSLEPIRILGTQEAVRFLNIAISPVAALHKTDPTLLLYNHKESETVEEREARQPLIVCSGFKRNRLYLFTNSEPLQTVDADGNVEIERDLLNEKPTKEEINAAQSGSRESASVTNQNRRVTGLTSSHLIGRRSLENFATIHTSVGDIYMELYPTLTPKTVENFVTHSKNGYYNGRVFHRVIKHFMIQTGCPHGTGSGGVSIFGETFEDEFHPTLKQDKAFLVCMANTGERNTNGSQFFITIKPCPWLENKHTIFGKVFRGMEIVQKISNVSTDKNDKPVDDIFVTSITVRHQNNV